MKKLNNYIQEKLIVNNTIDRYMYHPKTKNELIDCIEEKIDKEGLGTEENPLYLNNIDTSKITDMSKLFDADDGYITELSKKGHFDISDWDVSNVINMEYMFWKSNFNGDISRWNTSSVENMSEMFWNSNFDGNISDWDVRNVKNMEDMFYNCPLEKNPPKWYK